MNRHWLTSYPEGVAHDIDTEQFSSLSQLLEDSFKKNAAKPFSVCFDRWMSYGVLDELSAQLGAWLQSMGLEKDARVAIMLPNIPQFAVTMAAILRAGYTCVNVNPLYTARELEHQLKDSGATAIVILENFASTLADVIEHTPVKHVVMASMGDLLGFWYGKWLTFAVRHLAKMVPAYRLSLSDDRVVTTFVKALGDGAGMALKAPHCTLDSIAFLQYTGGTTGVSKGAVLTHRNLIANLEQLSAWMDDVLKERQEVVIQPLPLYHIFALSTSLVYLKQGCESVLIANPRDLPGFIKELSSRRWTVLTGVNTLFNSLLHHPDFRKLDFTAVKLCLGGGMAVQRTVADQWQQLTGKPLVEAYGLTETSPGATANLVNLREYSGTIGLPLPSTVITIRDDNEVILGVGETGEICIKGPQVMKGYWLRPDETAKVITRDGSFKTGDIGIMDAKGFVKIVDRKKDMILVSGFNVYPNEIEDVVASCPGVLEVCAVAAADEKSGEIVRVVIVKKDPALTTAQVLDYCRANLTGYKVPKLVEFWDELPKTNVGKVLRRTVRDTPAISPQK